MVAKLSRVSENVNRGAAIYEGMIIRALMDDRLVALEASSGKEIWTAKSPDPVTHANGYAMTGAPLIVDGVVIMGVAGAEYSHRGLVEGYDAKTGEAPVAALHDSGQR